MKPLHNESQQNQLLSEKRGQINKFERSRVGKCEFVA